MTFEINQNATLPVLKLELIQDGRNDFRRFYDKIQNANITFSMYDSTTGIKKIGKKRAATSLVTPPSCIGDTYYLVYQFSDGDTSKAGSFVGQFEITFLDGSGILIVPIRESLNINVLDNGIKNNRMRKLVEDKLHELLKLKRFPVPNENPEAPNQEVLVAASDLPDPREAGNETFKNKDALKKDGLFAWDKFKKMWVAQPENLQAAQQRINSINKKEEFVSKLEDLEQVVSASSEITDQTQIESKLTSYINDLANATDEKAADAAIRRYLTFQSKFHKYSFTNTILIWLQKENSTKVAGRGDWKTKFNRYVVAGAQPIWIFAPLIAGGKKENGEEGLDKEVQSGRLMGFKAVQVFDVSDTKPFDPNDTGEKLAEPESPQWWSTETPTETTEKLFGYIASVVEKLGIKLTYNPATRGEKGTSYGGHINMVSEVKGAGEVSTLVHELAHELMHKPNSKFYQGDDAARNRPLKELQAESVAYVVMKHYNIPIQHNVSYIALWKGSKQEILNNMQPIQKVSKFIIDSIDEVAEGDQIAEELYL